MALKSHMMKSVLLLNICAAWASCLIFASLFFTCKWIYKNPRLRVVVKMQFNNACKPHGKAHLKKCFDKCLINIFWWTTLYSLVNWIPCSYEKEYLMSLKPLWCLWGFQIQGKHLAVWFWSSRERLGWYYRFESKKSWEALIKLSKTMYWKNTAPVLLHPCLGSH